MTEQTTWDSEDQLWINVGQVGRDGWWAATLNRLNQPKQAAEPFNSHYAYWDDLFTRAKKHREIIMWEQPQLRDELRAKYVEAAEKRAKKAAEVMFDAVATMRHGQIRENWRSLPIMHNNHWGPTFADLTLANLRVAPPMFDGVSAWWLGVGRQRKLVVGAEDIVSPVLPDDVLHLYEAHPTIDLAQQWFVAASPNIEPQNKPKSLARLGRIRNIELRRALIQVYGVKGSGEPLQRDDYGALHRVDDQTNAVHVTCPSTGREYWLGVPATCETAREAVLWSFNINPKADPKLMKEA